VETAAEAGAGGGESMKTTSFCGCLTTVIGAASSESMTTTSFGGCLTTFIGAASDELPRDDVRIEGAELVPVSEAIMLCKTSGGYEDVSMSASDAPSKERSFSVRI
jgi:hypothetical protein